MNFGAFLLLLVEVCFARRSANGGIWQPGTPSHVGWTKPDLCKVKHNADPRSSCDLGCVYDGDMDMEENEIVIDRWNCQKVKCLCSFQSPISTVGGEDFYTS